MLRGEWRFSLAAKEELAQCLYKQSLEQNKEQRWFALDMEILTSSS